MWLNDELTLKSFIASISKAIECVHSVAFFRTSITPLNDSLENHGAIALTIVVVITIVLAPRANGLS